MNNYSSQGGFVAGGEDANSTPTKSGNNTSHRILPVTIKQALEATSSHEDDELKIDGLDLSLISLVGFVTGEPGPSDTYAQVRLSDCTGSIEIRIFWGNKDMDRPDRSALTKGSYINVIGRLKNVADRIQVAVSFVRVITDYNEVFYHLVHATAVHLENTGRLNPAGGSNSSISVGDPKIDEYLKNLKTSQLDNLQKDVLKVFINSRAQNQEEDEGVAATLVAQKLNQDPAAVLGAIEYLTDYGFIFNTVEDQYRWSYE